MLCPNCGAEITGHGDACPFCGSPTASAAPPAPAGTPATPPAPSAEPPSDVTRCGQCGHTNLSSDAVCVLCGAPLGSAEGMSAPPAAEALTCGQCGRENLPDSAYCVACGAPLGVPASGPTAPPSEAPASVAALAGLASGLSALDEPAPSGEALAKRRRKLRGCCLVIAIVGALSLIALVAFANQVARELNRLEIGGGSPAGTPAAVPTATAIAPPTSVPAGGATAPLLDTGRALAVASQEVGAQGGSLAVFDLTSALYGLQVQVPAGALSEGDRAMLLASFFPEPPRIQPPDMLQEDPTLLDSLDALVEAPPDPALAYHPIWQAPAMLAGEWDLVSPLALLEPEGYTFEQPVLVTLPLDAEVAADVVDPLDMLVMGRSESNGVVTWEIVREWALDRESATVSFQTTHFSSWGAWLWRKTGNAFYAGYLHTYGAGELLALQAQLPQDTLKNVVKAMVCSPRELFVDMSRAPDRFDALVFLGWGHGGSLGGGLDPDYVAMEKRLSDWLLSLSPRNNTTGTGTRAPGTVGVEEIFAQALEIADGDVFAALLTSHSIMRIHQKKHAVQELMRPYRPDGEDQAGAYYHLFGTAMHSFLHEHNKTSGWVEAFTPAVLEGIATLWRPETAVFGEETFFASEGGDIRGDTMEYALDRHGVELGRALYQVFTGMGTGEMAQAYGIDPAKDCQTPVVPPAAKVAYLRGNLGNLKPEAPAPVLGMWWGWWKQDAGISSWLSGGCPVYPFVPQGTNLALYLEVDYGTGHVTGTWSGSSDGQTAGFSPPDVVRQAAGTLSGSFEGGTATMNADGKGFTFEGQGTTAMEMSGTISCAGRDAKSTAASMTLPTTIRGEWREGKGFVGLEAGSEELGMRFTIWAVDPPFAITP